MSAVAMLDADASRSRSGILTPSSDASLSRHDGTFPPSDGLKKRGSSTAMDNLLQAPITIKPHPLNLHLQPRVVQPLMLLPRQHLPLSSIDFGVTNADLFPGRFVEAHIKILDLESRVGPNSSVLIARHEPKGHIHALERQENGLYVVCRLGAWVDVEFLASKATAVVHERLFPTQTAPPCRPTETAITTPQLHKAQKTKRAAIEAIQSLVKKRARSQSGSILQEIPTPNGTAVPEPEPISCLKTPSPDTKPQDNLQVDISKSQDPLLTTISHDLPETPAEYTAESILGNLRAQYFEALYKSMGSLAYFAKGPLSRARSKFHLDLEANLDMSDLIDFLKSMVLTTVQIDHKYRETIPGVIAKMRDLVDSSDEARKKKRKPKKMKLGKDNLYPAEDESIRAWWNATKPESKDDESSVTPDQVKSHVTLLRTRETQLQMIIILEILALEPLKAADEVGTFDLPMLPGATALQETPVAPPKKRNKHNLPVLLDVHADRLAIWQSIATDEQLLLEDTQMTSQAVDGQLQQKPSPEPLKDFCVDVIIPFFSARLPVESDSVSRKLGGPAIISPPKATSLKRQSSKRDQKPRKPTKRPAAPNAPRTLQRALSTEQHHRRSVSRGPSSMIALMRSATSTAIPTLKREGSESFTSMTTPTGSSDGPDPRRASLSRNLGPVNFEDPKAKKRALVEAELKDAISALRKPNRDVVGKALAETAQRQAAASSSATRLKKSGRGMSNAVQVKATPTNFRFKDMFPAKPELVEDVALLGSEEIIPPSSIGPMVPSTAPRRGYKSALPGSASSTLGAITGTPHRSTLGRLTYQQAANEDEVILPSSPLMCRDLAKHSPDFEDSTRPVRKLDFMSCKPEVACETPVKGSLSAVSQLAAGVTGGDGEGKKLTIYQQMGWDDDDLDDFL
ncbi:hypothetical protein S40285_05688 [Stachybotrys chlorohalonatus IBT 40285]|uniref:DNA replication regulator Sld3 C-terminal domain-containing protein n=1 Tax=Stachybotrys chlorohalonatus (strain IBT 40285) TaxID=1283841 RepID=A0A084QF07_STAC4|nr:hypothetical protein S40285_05688 [Stachybotrys chlorohalonata IBT 40285]